MSEEILSISGYQNTLESGAKVWIGLPPKEKGSVYLRFTNPEGIETRLCLSLEAMSAVVDIWTRIAIRNVSAFNWKIEVKEDGSMVCESGETPQGQ